MLSQDLYCTSMDIDKIQLIAHRIHDFSFARRYSVLWRSSNPICFIIIVRLRELRPRGASVWRVDSVKSAAFQEREAANTVGGLLWL